MFNVCPRCGEYRPDKVIDPEGPFAVCPVCGYRHPFRQMSLLLIGGPSAAGKTAVLLALAARPTPAVLLDGDILWAPRFNQPETRYRDYFELWLCMAKNIGQSGRPAALFGAGFAVPENIEPCVQRRYFSAVHYLALVCREDVLEARLRTRPAWRNAAEAEFIAHQMEFNRWLTVDSPNLEPRVALVDTTSAPLAATVEAVANWIAEHVA
jgi:hypothetical protein